MPNQVPFSAVKFFIDTTQDGTIALAAYTPVPPDTSNATVTFVIGTVTTNCNIKVNWTSGAITSGDLSPTLTVGNTQYDRINGTFRNLTSDHGGGKIHPVKNLADDDPSWSATDSSGMPIEKKRKGRAAGR